MGYMRRAFVLLPFLCLLSLFGCNHDQGQIVGGFAHPPMRKAVISLAPSTTELVASYAGSTVLVGRTQSCDYPKTVLQVPVVADVKPNYEAIAAAKPGTIVYDPALYSAADIQTLKDKEAKDIAYIEIKGDTIDQFVDSLYALGKALHSESAVSDYVDLILGARSSAAGDPLPSSVKVAIVLPGSAGAYMMAGLSSFQADCLKAAGATPIGPDGNLFVSVSPEKIVEMNPDMIVLASSKDAAPKAVEAMLADPRLKPVKAIQGKKIIVMDEEVVERRGGRVDKLIDAMHRRLKAAL